MKHIFLFACLLSVALFFPASLGAQTDDVRQATGLPIPIGAPVIYGQVTLQGQPSGERKPLIFVSLFVGGAQIDRRQTNDAGYYYFLTRPVDGATLVFEANNMEVGRVVLTSSSSSSVRQDVTIDWNQAKRNLAPPGVISAKDSYTRSPGAEKEFEKALDAEKQKLSEAGRLFEQVVAKDPKDFVAWTELGSVYFANQRLGDAESAYSKALALKADFVPALMNLGKLYLAQKNYEKSIATLFNAVSADSSSADAFYYLGEAYLGAKQGSKAVISLNEAIRLAPQAKAELHLRLAALYNAAGAKDRAVNEYKLFLEKKPDYPDRLKLEAYIKANGK